MILLMIIIILQLSDLNKIAIPLQLKSAQKQVIQPQ